MNHDCDDSESEGYGKDDFVFLDLASTRNKLTNLSLSEFALNRTL
jgi:hypothetical protein